MCDGMLILVDTRRCRVLKATGSSFSSGGRSNGSCGIDVGEAAMDGLDRVRCDIVGMGIVITPLRRLLLLLVTVMAAPASSGFVHQSVLAMLTEWPLKRLLVLGDTTRSCWFWWCARRGYQWAAIG
jgi:hypothetical protein